MFSWLPSWFTTKIRSTHRRGSSQTRLCVEHLEGRDNPSTVDLLGGGTLNIVGTDVAEDVRVYVATSGPSSGKLVVEDRYGSGPILVGITEFNPSQVTSIVFYGEGGDDRFTFGYSAGRSIPLITFAGNGNDTIRSGTGVDYIFGGAGNDTLYGNFGRDQIYGDSGDDVLRGDESADYLSGGSGNDTIFGGYPDLSGPGLIVIDEDDELHGGPGDDILNGEMGDDLIYGEDGNDYLIGGEWDSLGGANDILYGGNGNDYLYGMYGDDQLYGGAGDDYLYGLEGNDYLYGEAGLDRLYGDEGNDYLNGGKDGFADYLTGGSGADRFVWYLIDVGETLVDYNPSQGDTTIYIFPVFTL
jgi:Ca2+-binding RTX toxin-like protein